MRTCTQTDESARHKAKMANRKAAQDAEVAAKTVQKGLLIIHTGKGKGKSTAAWGLLLRALGRGFTCGVVQFGKGAWQTGERTALERFGSQIEWHTLGEGFTWETQDRARDVAAAERAWAKARELLANPAIRLVVLDELNIALRYDYLDLAAALHLLDVAELRGHLHAARWQCHLRGWCRGRGSDRRYRLRNRIQHPPGKHAHRHNASNQYHAGYPGRPIQPDGR